MGRKYRDFPYHCCFPHMQRVSNYQYPTPKWYTCCLSLFSCLGLSDSSWPHGLQHIGHPCPSPFPELAQTHIHWVGDAIQPSCSLSSPTVPFSSCLQSFPASGSFVISQLFKSGDQSIGASASASVPPMNIQDWFPLGLTGLILQSTGLSRVFSNNTFEQQFKSISSLVFSILYGPTLTSIHDYRINHSLDQTDLVMLHFLQSVNLRWDIIIIQCS